MEKKYDLNFIDKVFDQQEKRGDLKEIKLKTGSTVQDTIYDVKNTKPPIIQTIIEQLENNVIKNLISEKEFPESYNLINSVSDIVQDMGYYLIPPESRIQYPLDLLAFRLLEINKKVTIILLIPIIIDTNHFNILVSEQTIRYDTNDHTKINPFGEQLEQVAEALFKELVTEQHIFQIIKSKLNTHISIEKTIERRPLYFQSGKVECKIRVDPILINEYTPLFSEKALSFAYQRQSNLLIPSDSNSDLVT